MTTACQRWRKGRAFYRPAGELFNPARAEVHILRGDRDARGFVERHHYAASYPAARFRVGLFIKPNRFQLEQLAGVAVFSVPMSQAIIPRYFGIPAGAGVELGRLVLLDEVAANAESWFVARAFRLLREQLGVDGVLAYSDPFERVRADGLVVKRGHIGTVYQALNATYRGRSRAQEIIISADGRLVSRRALSKLRNDEVGAAYAYQQLRGMGAPARLPLETGHAYCARALRDGPFRRHRHLGNHTYTWWLGARRSRPQWDGIAYPKADAAPVVGLLPALEDAQ